jgi:WD40 repeat protein
LQGGYSRKGQVLRGHRQWVRAIACSTDGDRVCSAAKDVRVWSTDTLLLLYVLPAGQSIYSLAISRDTAGPMPRDTLYAGCKRGKIRYWFLSDIGTNTKSDVFASRLEHKVRALACHGDVLLVGDNAGDLRAWDMSARNGPEGRSLDAHTAGVRAIDVDILTHLVYTASDDRSIRVWGETELRPML